MESKFDATIADLEEDIAIFDEVKAKPDKVSELVYMQQRHVLQKNSNHQFVEAVKPEHKKDPDWKASLQRIVKRRCRVACPTLIVEEINGIMKNKNFLRKPLGYAVHRGPWVLCFSLSCSINVIGGPHCPSSAPPGPRCSFLPSNLSSRPGRRGA